MLKSNLIFYLLICFLVVNINVQSQFKSNNCNFDRDCQSMNYCSEGNCIHKPLFPSPSVNEIIGCVLIFVLVTIANPAGIGGMY